ncbi:MAG: hypothetical protein IAG13_01770 [Deltaproteobacteria bacterium]|nr:hypothetical protein [Nannocystaceae bacterium]
MTTPDLRFYAFVSRFVDAVSNEAMTAEMLRSRDARRRFQQAHQPAAVAVGTVALPERRAA